MTLGRLNGDRVVNSLGRYRVLLLGSLCAALGLSGHRLQSRHRVAGRFHAGRLGASNVVPILFSAAGSQRDMPANLAIASVTTVGYAGILAGPALIGFIAPVFQSDGGFRLRSRPAVGGNRQRQGRHSLIQECAATMQINN